MKKNKNFKWFLTVFVLGMIVISQNTYSQVVTHRFPDGRVVYSDGSIRWPNGTVTYPNGKNNPVTFPNPARNPNNRYGKHNRQWLPPGQAKKRDGAHDARDYAPGHQKHKERDDYDDDRDENKNWKHKHKGDHGDEDHGDGNHGNGKHGKNGKNKHDD